MIRRSPPNAPASPHYTSEPNLTSCPNNENLNITQRKRKRESDELGRMEKMMMDMKTMFEEFVSNQTQQNNKIDTLQMAIEEIRTQNAKIAIQNSEIRTQNEEIQKTMSFLSDKYDEAVLEINNLKAECNKNQQIIKTLENKVDFLEKNLRAASLEIKNVPLQCPETRETLISTIQKLGNIVNHPVLEQDIANIFRLKSKKESVGTVIVEFSSAAAKQLFLKSTKIYNKQNKENRLNTTHLQEKGPKHFLYVSEVLTAMTKRLYYLAREFIKSSEYEQCWTANGKVYIRKKEGMPSRLIKTEDDLAQLRRQK
ncbi:unnamed protein product [Parnassius apollo]|uniref:(apollo) hypothetical protein n=1 Tax=Parnassius apollo TaxID=110799 RepID=A0A8S3WVS8_PARAO|nr:unnamed protein product [Parnassius apollo]